MRYAGNVADLVQAAQKAGADACDVLLTASTALSVQRRLGKIEQLERAEAVDVGLRVFLGTRQAIVSATDPDPRGFAALAERAVAMARVVPEDPYSGLPADFACPATAELDLVDPMEPSADSLIALCAEAEDAALAVPGVTNSEGAEAGWSRTEVFLAVSNGFVGQFARTQHSLFATALAGHGVAMERDYDSTNAVHRADLEQAELIGRRAGERAVARLAPVRPRTAKMPVVYDPRVSASLVGHLVNAINGASVARGTTFLRGRLGQQVMAAGLSIVDDPLRPRGLRSRPFDVEGMTGQRRELVRDGVLTTWLLDSRSARQLGTRSTGHAARSPGGPPLPSPTNLWLEAGSSTPEELMADVKEGLYITEFIGMGVNGVTGDYSRGAAGFMIRNGMVAEAVSGITIAGRLQDMFLNLTVADDLRFRRGTDAPTIRVEGLTVAGA